MKYIVTFAAVGLLVVLSACGTQPKPWLDEGGHYILVGNKQQTWAVAPAINLSGVGQIDPLLQSDLLYAELQQVNGLTVLPVNRVAEVYHSLKIEKVQTEEQAFQVCDLLGCDALVVPTITAYDPYDPPKVAASIQVFLRPQSAEAKYLDVHSLERSATDLQADYSMPTAHHMVQAVGIYDADDGTVRHDAMSYATGRTDPNGPMGEKIVFASMDQYSGFVYHQLLGQVLADYSQGHFSDLPQTRPAGSVR